MSAASAPAADAAPPGKRKDGKFKHGGRRAQVRSSGRQEQEERRLEDRDAAEGPQRVSSEYASDIVRVIEREDVKGFQRLF